jgi:Type I phosphodiesterase / nucleotide pyrophosphatase
MASTSKDRLIYLDSMVDLSTIDHIDCWPLKGLRPRTSENLTALYEYLKVLSIDQHWNVYLRDLDMPPRWHFTASYRIAPIYLVPDPEWVIVNSLAEFDPEEDEEYQPRGIHGYDNDDELMRSLFLARGPSFQYNYPIRPFENVEVYGIMTNILGITANSNNGTFDKGRLERLPVSQTPSNPTTSVDDVSGATPSATHDENEVPEMTPEDWEQVEDDVEEAEAEDRPLTWKEYLEFKAEEMKEELDSWWDWMKHGGKGADEGTR